MAQAQDVNGILTGTVTDSSGAVIPGAKVTITSVLQNVVVWRGETNASGLYLAPSIPVGVYNLQMEAEGFKRIEIKNVKVNINQRVGVNAALELGQVAETVTVAGEAIGALETETSSTGGTINTNQVLGLPLPSRNVLNLLTLVGGVSSGGSATGINSSQLSINGSRTLNSEFNVDGVSVVNGSTGGLNRLPSTEAMRELKVLTSGYSAEYGRTSGGSINAVVTSGTNELHGGVYHFFRNEKLNANNFFRNVRGEQRLNDRYNQYGAKLGGPLSLPKLYRGRDRTFFFANFERLDRRNPVSNLATIPDAAFREGDFSASPFPVFQPGSRVPYPGNRVPVSQQDAAARRIMSFLPAPNSPGSLDAQANRRVNNFVNNFSNAPNTWEITSRVDHYASSKLRLNGRFTHYRSDNPSEPILPGPLDNAVGPGVTTGYQASVGGTYVLSPAWLVEINGGFLRNNPIVDPPAAGFNVQEGFGIARSVGTAPPRFNITGWALLGTNDNTFRRQIDNNYQFSAAMGHTRGAHNIRFGFQMRKNQHNNENRGGNWTGVYNVTGDITNPNNTGGNSVNALADFLLGNVKTSVYALTQPLAGRRNANYAGFVQDDWKFSRRLTVNLGLRWEYEGPMTSSNNIYSRIDIVTLRLLAANVNASRSLNLEGAKRNFAPRVGFAYSLNEKTVIRSAFGAFYSQIFSNLGGAVTFQGYTVTQNFINLGPGVAQPFRLREGMPLVAVQNLNDPLAVERTASPSNPLAGAAQFGEISPMPRSLQWNFGIQREILRGTVIDVSYVASRGLNLPLSLPFNQFPLERAEEVARQGNAVFTQSQRPNPNVSGFSSFVHAGTSSYHSLQARFNRQFSSNFAFLGNYTWSKSIDDGSGLFNFSQPNGLDNGQLINIFRRLDRSISAFDRRHTFAAAVQYRTGGPKWLRNIEINPIVTARQGLPDTITQGGAGHPLASQARPNVINTNGGGFAPQRTSEGTAIRYLLPTNAPNFPFAPSGSFFTGTGANRVQVLPVQIGNLAKNSTREPGEFNVDISVARRFALRDKISFTVRAEAFNALNNVNFNGPNTGLTVTADPRSGAAIFNSPNFGLITGARSARFMQLVARFDF